MDADFVAACKALGLEPREAVPPLSLARQRAERQWREITRRRPQIEIVKRRRTAA